LRAKPPDEAGAVAAALHKWLVSGAAQSERGAFWAFCEIETGRPSFEYPEITGYALTYMAGRPALSPAERAAGERAASWLVERLVAGHLSARDGWDNGAVYLFDLAMIAAGLLSFGRRIGAERLIESGHGLAALLRRSVDADPSLSPVWASGPPSTRRAWSTLGRAHLAKVVQALLLDELGPGEGAASLVEGVKRLQLDNGRIATGPEPTTMLHPHLYAAEGLWIWGSACGDSEALERARAAIDWAFTEQLPTGGFPRSAGGSARWEQSDVTAQALRLALAVGLESTGVDRAAARLTELAFPGAEGNAIIYQPAAARRHLNTWATLFAAQALSAAGAGARLAHWFDLV